MNDQNPVQTLLFSSQKCSICTAIKPKLKALMAEYPNLDFNIINAEQEPGRAAGHSVFNVPVLLILAEGREYRRYQGAFSMDTVRSDIDRLYLLMED